MKTGWLMLLLLALAPAARAGGDPGLAREVEAVLRQAEKIWDQRDSARYFDDLWSKGSDVVYMSEWFYPVFYGREATAAYFKPQPMNLYAHRERYSNIEATYIAPDLAVATYQVRYDEHAQGRMPLGGWSRVVMMLRKEQGQWRILGQFDAPMSLISQVRRLQEEALSNDFLDYARAQNPGYDKQVAADKAMARRRSGLPWISGGGNTQPDAPASQPKPARQPGPGE